MTFGFWAMPNPAQNMLTPSNRRKWKTVFRDAFGNLRAQGVELRKDGTFILIVADGNGGTLSTEGTWTYQDDILTSITTSRQVTRGKIIVINENEVIFHDENLNQRLVYQRIPD